MLVPYSLLESRLADHTDIKVTRRNRSVQNVILVGRLANGPPVSYSEIEESGLVFACPPPNKLGKVAVCRTNSV